MSEESVDRQVIALRPQPRRTLQEHLLVRIPALVRLLGWLSLRFPPGSWLRRALLARSLQQVYEAFNRGDMEVNLLFSHPDVELHTAKDLAGVPFGADLEDVYRGHEGLVAFRQRWMEAWEYRNETEEAIDCGEKLVVLVRHRARGRHSGVEIDQPYAQVVTRGHDGRAVRLEIFWDRAKALEAAGLSE